MVVFGVYCSSNRLTSRDSSKNWKALFNEATSPRHRRGYPQNHGSRIVYDPCEGRCTGVIGSDTDFVLCNQRSVDTCIRWNCELIIDVYYPALISN
ncbi:hypothetical protein EVAR_20034_1 [Eumeta japonica]|uniref:Uncharacterized protein n=1 Tax=Eumeta variegata TaxID=151549 RepID=A0A4C1UIN4_EUMVA|nr:hypothetical protein EVAR_20034_1 [Eumeta japonica]